MAKLDQRAAGLVEEYLVDQTQRLTERRELFLKVLDGLKSAQHPLAEQVEAFCAVLEGFIKRRKIMSQEEIEAVHRQGGDIQRQASAELSKADGQRRTRATKLD